MGTSPSLLAQAGGSSLMLLTICETMAEDKHRVKELVENRLCNDAYAKN